MRIRLFNTAQAHLAGAWHEQYGLVLVLLTEVDSAVYQGRCENGVKGASKWCEYPLVRARGPIITPKGWPAAHALNDCGVARTVRATHEKHLLYGSMVMSGA